MSENRGTGSMDSSLAADAAAILRVTFDRRSAVPLYRQLKFHVVHAISTGRLRPGTTLPSVRAVCRELGLASATVQRAYAELQTDGLVVTEPGRGIFVGGLEDHLDTDVEDRERGLREILLGPLTQAQALGFRREEIVTVIRALLPDEPSGGLTPRVLFVGRVDDAVAKYTQLLRAALAGTPAEVLGVRQDTYLDDDGRVLSELTPIHLVVSLVTSFGEVRAVAHRRGIETYALMVELSEETKRALIELPYDAHVALVTEHVFLSNTRALIDQIRGHQGDIVWATELDDDLGARLSGADVVLHSLGAKHLVATHAPVQARLIELEFLPMPASLTHLVETIAAVAHDSQLPSAGIA